MTMDRLRSISPTTLNQLIACPAKVYLDSSSVRPRTSSPNRAALLGTVVHRTLELLVTGGQLFEDELSETVDRSWATALREAGLEDERKAARLPGYFLKKARVLNAAKRLVVLLAGVAELSTEIGLESPDRIVRGRVDLAAALPDGLTIVDYKSGIQRDRSDGTALMDEYATQLRIYCWLWAASRGPDWPTHAYLLPLDGPPIEVDVRRGLCEQTVEEALRTLGRFNDSLPESLPPTPSPSACRFCRHLLECSSLASEASQAWSDRLLLVIAEVVSAEASQGGGYSLLLRLQGGSVEGASASLVRVNPSQHPAVLSAVAGSRLAATGLYRVDGENAYCLRDNSILVVEAMGAGGVV